MMFQSTLPRGERLGQDGIFACFHTFQSTLPRGERHNVRVCIFSACKFQSTLPRGERPDASDRVPGAFPVSIHAPARGATSWLQ